MPADFQFQAFTTFTLVLARVASLVLVAPIFGSPAVSLRVRALVALALALLIAPLELSNAAIVPQTLGAYLVAIGGEALVGLTLGLGVMLLFSAMHVAGNTIAQMSGMQLAQVVDPSLDGESPVVSQLLYYLAMAVFVAIGGHRLVMEALLDTFVWLPAGQGSHWQSAVDATTSLLAQSFALGVRAAAPVMLALLLATLVMGIVSRTLPQINMLATGLGLNALLALGVLGVSLGTTAWIFEEQIEPTIETILDALTSTASR